MQNIIESLYYGEISPLEQVFSNDSIYQNHLKCQVEVSQELESTLSEEQKTLFKDYQQKVNDTASYTNEQLFYRGFKTGARMVMEILK